MKPELKEKIVELIISEDDTLDLGVDAIALVEEPAIEETFLYFKKEEFVEPTAGESEGDFIGRCMSSLEGEFPEEDQRLAVCYTYWKGSAEFQDLEDACWPGYEAIGLKPGKGGRMVPNCVPMKSSEEKFESYNDYPESATAAAKRALEWRDAHPDQKCGTPVGWARANQLAKGENISEETIARMASFARHLQYKDVPYSEGCGGLMVDAWGGQAGIEWASNKLEEIRTEMQDEREINVLGYNTKNFKLCPGAIATFQHLVQMNPDEDTAGMIRSAALQADAVFGIEKRVLEAGTATVEDLYEATLFVKDFFDLMKEIDSILGMEHNVDYMYGHLDVIGNLVPEEAFVVDVSGLTPYIDQITEDKKKDELITILARETGFTREELEKLGEAQLAVLEKAASCGIREKDTMSKEMFVSKERQDRLDAIATSRDSIKDAVRDYREDKDMGFLKPGERQTRYKYAQISGTSGSAERDFCAAMMRLSRYYTRAEIDAMSAAGVNGKFGEGNSTRYDIFQFRGGSYCKHFWKAFSFIKPADGSKQIIMVSPAEDGPSNRVPRITGVNPSPNYGGQTFSACDHKHTYSAYHFAEDKRIVTGPAMVPNMMIPRKDEDGDKYYVYFTEETIRKIMEKFMRNQKQNRTNIEHNSDDIRTDNYVYESWIIEDPMMDKSQAMGFRLPKGTWMISMRVMDEQSWKLVKEGKLKGFSVEGFFGEMKPIDQTESLYNAIVQVVNGWNGE